MRRPIIFAALSFGSGIVIEYHLSLDPAVLIILLTGMLALYVYLQIISGDKRYRITVLLICISLIGSMWLEIQRSSEDPFEGVYGEKAVFSGVVTEISVKENMYTLVVSNEDAKVLVKYYTESSGLKTARGHSAVVAGNVELPQQRRNPGCFDYRLYLRSCGIRTVLKAESIDVSEEAAVKYQAYIGQIRNRFEHALCHSKAEGQAGLIMAIMFGDKTLLDEEVYEDFQKNGTAHVLAVSGLHTGLLYAFFAFLWRGRKGVLFYTSACIILLFYMALADFSPSVVRAACMIILHLIAGITRSRYDLLSAAGATFVFMLLMNPYQMFHTGFQMSFLAIVSLAVIIPFAQRFYQGIFLSAVAIQAGMMPYTAYLFNYISVGAIIANIPVIFLTGIIMPIGLCALASVFIHTGVFDLLAALLNVSCSLLVRINDIFYAGGATSFDVISPSPWIMTIYYGVIFFCLSEAGQILFMRKNKKAISIVFACVLTVSMISVPVMRSPLDGSDIVFVDVGQGDCIHVRTPSGKNYLIDGGGSTDYDTGLKTVKPYLLKNGVRKVDAAFVTHLHEDHYGGIRSLAADGMIKKVAVYDANRMIEPQLIRETSSEIIYLYSGQRVELDEDIYIDVIYPEKQAEEHYKDMIVNNEDENEASLIMKLNYKGTTVLITGDIDEEGEQELVSKYAELLDSDIMKVPHHGSKYSSSAVFVDTVSPVLAVFQVGKNNYGHPSPEAIDAYKRIGCRIARNDKEGAIGVSVEEDGSLKVIGMIH